MDKSTKMLADGSVTVLKYEGEEKVHRLWSTPVVLAKPFDDDFLAQLREDIKRILPIADKNSVDVWQLPDLPETMIKVRDKKLEIAERVFKEDSEMPLPPLRISKGYFRYFHPNQPYKITPHHHGSTLGAGIFYINIDQKTGGNLVMMDPRGGVNYNNQFSPFKRIRLEEGLMIISPGYLVHFVEPTNPDPTQYPSERLMIVSNIHRIYEDFIKELDKNECYINSMGRLEL